jgi:hypothetical protein
MLTQRDDSELPTPLESLMQRLTDYPDALDFDSPGRCDYFVRFEHSAAWGNRGEAGQTPGRCDLVSDPATITGSSGHKYQVDRYYS